MTTRGLKISDDLTLPLEAVTEPIGILASRRAGKSNAAVVMAEEMFDAGLHWVAIDPKGDWWGLRSAGDGKGPGLPVPILGGRHGDVPLEPSAGAVIADLIVDEHLTCVVDVSGFASEAEKIRFLLAFGDRLFRRKEQGQEPTHVFFEEADDYAPQRAFPEQAKLVHVMARILKQGGARGLGGTVISQRSAVVHKDLLSQVQTMIALRTTGPQDRKAIRDWVSFSGENPQIIESIHELADGEAWVWSPNWLRLTKRIKFRRRRTYDSGATPKVGASRRPPATLSDVDLGALTQRMAATIERAKADDPKELRRRIRELERELAERPAAEPEIVERVVEVISDAHLTRLAQGLEGLVAYGDKLRDVAQIIDNRGTALVNVGQQIAGAIERRGNSDTPRGERVQQAPRGVPARRPAGDRGQTAVATPASPATSRAPAPEHNGKLGKGERAILSVLAQYPDGRSKRQLAFLSGYSPRGGRFGNLLSGLRSAGYLEGSDHLRATATGVAAVPDVEPLPTGDALRAHWLDRLGAGERAVLEVLIDAYPEALPRDEAGRRAGYEPRGGRFGNILSALRTTELIEGTSELRASDDLF